MIGVVLDTNVVVSALLNEDGLEATVVDLALAGDVKLFASEAILLEYALTLARPKFRDIDSAHIKDSLGALRQIAEIVEPSQLLAVSPDDTDNRFLECAEAAKADFLVTGNKRHFPPQWESTRIVNAREFIEELATDHVG